MLQTLRLQHTPPPKQHTEAPQHQGIPNHCLPTPFGKQLCPEEPILTSATGENASSMRSHNSSPFSLSFRLPSTLREVAEFGIADTTSAAHKYQLRTSIRSRRKPPGTSKLRSPWPGRHIILCTELHKPCSQGDCYTH